MIEFEQKKNDDNGEDIVLPLNEIANLEIHLSGIMVYKMDMGITTTNLLTEDFDRDNIQELQMGGVMVNNVEGGLARPVSTIFGRFGPVEYDVYNDLNAIDMSELTEFANNSNEIMIQDQDLIITGIEFTKTKIKGIICILERMGISTAYTPHQPENNDDEPDDDDDDDDDDGGGGGGGGGGGDDYENENENENMEG
jgi:hypothetical protein